MSAGYETLSEHDWDDVQKVWELLDDGEVERARIGVDALLARRPGHADLRIVDAAVALEEGEADRALQALKGAERSADPSLFFHLRGLASYDLADFESARDDAERALAIKPTMAETHELLSKALEFLGDRENSQKHAGWAREIEPDAFSPILEVSDEEFDRVVEASLKELPPKVREHLDELPVLVEPRPEREMLVAEKPPISPDILGLFVGRHLMDRRHDDIPGSPGAIYLFRRNLLRACADRDELAKEIRITVQHEVGHLLGLDEDELEEWGLA